jgi:DNA-binding ferritin-like protein
MARPCGETRMNTFLIHRLRNAAIAADQRKDFNMAELLTEAINELEKAAPDLDQQFRDMGLL